MELYDILENLDWSPGYYVNTRFGRRFLRKTEPDEDFWDLWREDKEEIKKLGFSVTKSQDTGDWEICWWKKVDKELEEPVDEGFDNTYKEPEIEIDITNLFKFQIQPVKRLLASISTYNAALDASGTGIGKTFQACAVARHLKKRPFVVCPKAVIPSWKKAMAYMGVTPFGIINYESVKTGKTGAGKFETTGKDKFIWTLPENAMLIFDEVHRTSNRTSQNSKLILAAKDQKITSLTLSATVAHSPLQLYSLGYLLGLHEGDKSFYPWAIKHGVRRSNMGMEFCGTKKHLVGLNREIFPRHGVRVRVEDLGDSFPDNLIMADAYDMGDAAMDIANAYQEMEQELAKLSMKESSDRGNALVIQLRARQRIELIKIPLLTEMAKEAIEEGKSVVIFCNFTESVLALAKQLKTSSIVMGGQKPEDRQYIIDQFQSDNERIIICNIQAGGVGISLHDLNGRHPRMSIICPTYRAVDLKQALGRIHRAGGKSKSIQKIVYCAGTLEESICLSVQQKINSIDQINDGDVAPEFNLVRDIE